MIEAGIPGGDNVVMAKQETADDGGFIVAPIENESTSKNFVRDLDGMRREHLCNPRLRWEYA